MLSMVAALTALAGKPMKMTYAHTMVVDRMMVNLDLRLPPNSRMMSWKMMPMCKPLTANIWLVPDME